MKIRILVTGSGSSGGANFVASLRMAKKFDFYIVGCDARKYYLEINQGLDQRYIVPLASDPDYLKTINKIIEKENIDFVYFHSEQEVFYAAENKRRIKANTFLPSIETLKITTDKFLFNQVMKEAGVSVAKSYHLKNEKDLKRALKNLLISGEKVWLRAIHGGGSKASLPVNNLLQARGWIDYWTKNRGLKYGDFMVSEFLPNKDFAFQSIWHNGELITSAVRERVEYLFGYLFPSGQSSSPSVARSIHREDLNELATKAIKAVSKKPNGVLCVDIKENKDGVPCVTEINAGRFFTTSNNFSTAGVNMPLYLVLLGLDKKNKIPKVAKYNSVKDGLYWVRLTDMGYKLIGEDEWTSQEI